MAYRTILVNLLNNKRAESVMPVAASLARRNEAHLIGLFVVPPLRVYPVSGFEVTSEMFEAHTKFYEEEINRTKAVFERFSEGDGFVSEWCTVGTKNGDGETSLMEMARAVDLVVVSQPEEDIDDYDYTESAVRLVMESARPVLFVPYAGKFDEVGKSVMVAWNGSREATRAVFDALPILRDAENVRLLTADPKQDEGEEASFATVPLAETLSRHGVKCESGLTYLGSLGVGDEILARLSDQGSDLLVMGAYGHSRLREFIFGGATKQILTHMTVPVLMSH